jgi:hypothetical protein
MIPGINKKLSRTAAKTAHRIPGAHRIVTMTDRVSSVLATFVSHHNVRAFIFDVMEMMDMPAGSLESILDRAGGRRRGWDLRVLGGKGGWRGVANKQQKICRVSLGQA